MTQPSLEPTEANLLPPQSNFLSSQSLERRGAVFIGQGEGRLVGAQAQHGPQLGVPFGDEAAR